MRAWIADLPLIRPAQSDSQMRGTAAMVRKHRENREAAYWQGRAEAPALLAESGFRDFVVLYLAEGYKRGRNAVSICNSDPAVMELAHVHLSVLAERGLDYGLQYHRDQDPDALRAFWADRLGIEPEQIALQRKSNSGGLKGRKWRSRYGVLTIRIGDTHLRARLEAWMDQLRCDWTGYLPTETPTFITGM